MRRLILCAALLCACGTKDAPKADSTAAMAPAKPAALTAEMMTGTWNGSSMAEKSDSVMSKWTVVGSGGQGKIIIDGTKDSIAFTTTYDADSSTSTSQPYPMSADPKAPKVTFRSVGRMKDGKLVGTSVNMLADKPDSVVARSRFEATKQLTPAPK